jgi:hypothetical protein
MFLQVQLFGSEIATNLSFKFDKDSVGTGKSP